MADDVRGGDRPECFGRMDNFLTGNCDECEFAKDCYAQTPSFDFEEDRSNEDKKE